MQSSTVDSEQELANVYVRAFNLSCMYLDKHADELFVPAETARVFLKLTIVELAESGERNPFIIAERGSPACASNV